MRKQREKKNYLLLDGPPKPDWIFKEYLEKTTGWKWEVKHAKSGFSDPKWKRLMKFFIFPLQFFFKRKEISSMISYQQFYGLIYAWYCSLFRVKKNHKLIITTFIYRPKTGVVGKVYHNFMKKIVNSPYIDKIICFSKAEPSYYEKIFNTKTDLFAYVPLAVGDISARFTHIKTSEEKYILSVGKSNRDYDFLVSVLGTERYPVKIICDSYKNEYLPAHIELYDNVYGDAYYEKLAECFCVVVPLADVHVSAGQLVFLQSMMFGKPVIVTKTDTVTDYILDGINGIIVEKEKECFRQAIERLYTDETMYDHLSEQTRKIFEKEFSLEKMAEKIGSFLLIE